MSREFDRIGYFATQERTLHVLIQIVVYRRELAADVIAASRHNTRYLVSKGERLKKKGMIPNRENHANEFCSLTDNRQVSTELDEHMFAAILKLDLVLGSSRVRFSARRSASGCKDGDFADGSARESQFLRAYRVTRVTHYVCASSRILNPLFNVQRSRWWAAIL